MYDKISFNDERWFDTKNLKNEKWKDIEGFEGIYEVSNYGRVKRKEHILSTPSKNQTCKFISNTHYDEKILKPLINKNGYIRIRLCKNKMKYNKLLHILVAKAFIPNPNSCTRVDHINGDKLCNLESNLEWHNVKVKV